MSGSRMVAGFALALACAVASAAGPVAPGGDAREIVARQLELRTQVEAGSDAFGDIGEDQRGRLLAEQDKVFALLDGRERWTDLPRDDQVTLVNSLERISAIVQQTEDDRMVCRRERATGSNMTQRICKTVAQLREERERARGGLGERGAVCSTCDASTPEGMTGRKDGY